MSNLKKAPLIHRFIAWLCRKFNYYPTPPEEPYVLTMFRELHTSSKNIIARLDEIQAKYQEAIQVDPYKTYEENKRLQQEHEEVRAMVKRTVAYYDKVSEDISKIINGTFRFNGQTLPGAMSIDTYGQNKQVMAIMRACLMDAKAAEVRNAVDYVAQRELVIRYMKELGYFNRLAEMLIQNGVINLTIGIHPENNTTEGFISVNLLSVVSQNMEGYDKLFKDRSGMGIVPTEYLLNAPENAQTVIDGDVLLEELSKDTGTFFNF